MQLAGYTWTKSKFLGLSIGVHMVGKAVLSLLDLDEEYIFTFPSAYGRSILTVPWFEMGGQVSITCAKTGYYSNIDFLTKVHFNYIFAKTLIEILNNNKNFSHFTVVKSIKYQVA